MTNSLLFYSGLFIFFVIFFILYFIRKSKINIKYSVIWLIIFGVLFIFLIIPGFLDYMTKLLGFSLSSNMIFSLLIASLVVINIWVTGIVSSQDKKIRQLIQEISILKNKLKDKK